MVLNFPHKNNGSKFAISTFATRNINLFIANLETVFGEGKEAAERTCKLLEALLNTLTKVFKHDSVGFVTPERFELLSAPLTDLLDNEVGGVILYKRRVRAHLTPCLTQLAVAGGDDSLWRGLACQVLQRLKAEDRPQVVLGALEVFQSLVETPRGLPEATLADAIPPISEVLESTNQEVVQSTELLSITVDNLLN
ncbi:HEAT repeat-containing protein 1-like [Eriocheir sinensis]|uniref:HEAT repeat-containing protein 1-like n=1 Tax=Eriocheir sinensis TaxID=95602 RepID=UPI0021C6323D|nr:HEAT repeat-containing protein 1-like [Eriocheir sinensis]